MPTDPHQSTSYFSEANSADLVIARNADCTDERLKAVMATIIKHLHAAVKEIEPTQEEWMKAIAFLTATGHKCDDWRQEFILLSDVLGVSMLVDTINNRRPEGGTESTVLGPFHVQDAPAMENGANINLDGKGPPLVVRGTVKTPDGRPISGATLDVWQANDEGYYDVQQKGIQPDFNLRGVFRSDEDGQYWFRGAKPRYYPVPTDGPVGDLLTALGRKAYRPAHLHFIVKADGFKPLTTHIFVPDDPYVDNDAVFGVKESLLADFTETDAPERARELGVTNPFWEVTFNFVLEPR